MNNMTNDVARFMHAAGQSQASPDLADLYLSLVKEELNELAHAITAEDPVAEADGIADSVWVLIGYALARGINFDCVWAEVTRSNLDKIHPDGRVHKNAQGKVQKPANWTGPDIAPCLRNTS